MPKPLTPKIGFYRPHDRRAFQATGELVDPKTGVIFRPPSRTKQEFKAECDINNIIKTFKQTGMVRHVSAQAQKGAYMDLPEPTDFQDSMNTVIAAQNAFSTLPSKVRERFANDPNRFLQFMSDPDNLDEAVTLGLVTKRPPPNASDPELAPVAPVPASTVKGGAEGV